MSDVTRYSLTSAQWVDTYVAWGGCNRQTACCGGELKAADDHLGASLSRINMAESRGWVSNLRKCPVVILCCRVLTGLVAFSLQYHNVVVTLR